ncbi:FkbM family methyltransferase [Planktomarina temperata]|nr:FkbM family methyltransferase [Planktomarina temperata]
MNDFLRRLMNRINPTRNSYISVFGLNLYQNVRDVLSYDKFSGKSIYFAQEEADGRIFKLIRLYVRKDSVAIDVGANIGLMTLIMAKYIGRNGRILSLEPGPVSFGLLRANVFTNGFENVRIIDKAASDRIGTTNLFINRNGESDNQVHHNIAQYTFKNEPSRLKIEIETTTLDSLIEFYDILPSRISFIKIDTQGHELSVLMGSSNLIRNSQQIAIVCEFAPYLKSWENFTIQEFHTFVVGLGLIVYDQSNLEFGIVDVAYLEENYGFDKPGRYTDLLLLKGHSRPKA